MGSRIVKGLVYAVVGYIVGAFGGGALVSVLSQNSHDRSVEAAMTGAFVTGPVVAVIGGIVGMLRRKPQAAKP
jgi:hypothetical protein